MRLSAAIVQAGETSCPPPLVIMGCAASSSAYGPPPLLTEVNGGFTDAIGEITKRRTGYVLESDAVGRAGATPWNAWFVREGGANKALDIKDDAGRVVYKIMPHGQAEATAQNFYENMRGRQKMHFVDGADKKLLVLERKQDLDVTKMELLSSKYYFYTYSPNFEGQASTEVDNDDLPLYPFAWAPDPQFRTYAMNEKEPGKHVKRFKTSNDEADSVTVLRYTRLELSPFRAAIKTPEGSAAAGDEYDRTILATVAKDFYLMSISAGAGAKDAKYFTWSKDMPAQWGVDCAAGMDSLLVIAICISAGCNTARVQFEGLGYA